MKGRCSQRYLGNAEDVAQEIELCEDLVDSRKELADPVKRALEYVKQSPRIRQMKHTNEAYCIPGSHL